ncbi:ArsR/SmtB family transcription factor [Parachitinimonas caeni]|uniref:Helix-turn-helix domain-containing protein n=1 Tax=Parachitinimonas caeni TaxID=3031301 RepID=A0ABT7DVP6_9NEIS|nr:helix-turn-helix domain-containing protein [Parachitinimonas caeni]
MNMQREQALHVFEALASAVRLDAYRLLVEAGQAGMVAGDLASQLDVAPSRLSFHLKLLTEVGLTTVETEGRYLRYRAHLPQMRELIAYLTERCCAGQPELCAEVLPIPAACKDC